MKLWRKKQSDIPRRRLRSDDSGEVRQPVERAGGNLFKRNRTLVGSLSASVSSANELGGDLRSPRAHVHHLTAHRRRLGSTLIIVIAVAVALTWFLYQFTAFMSIGARAGDTSVSAERYKSLINEYLAGRPLERLRMFLNEDHLQKHLMNVAPEVESIEASGSAGIATTQFDIIFRKPVAGWLIGSTQYYVDKDGISFMTNHFERPTVKIADQSGVPQTSGAAVASSRFLRFVGRTVELSARGGLVVEQAIIPQNTTRQIEVKLAGRPYPIKLSLDRPVGEQVEDLQRAVAYFDTNKLVPTYIDVRVSGKAFYK